jgi:hypothetical protein
MVLRRWLRKFYNHKSDCSKLKLELIKIDPMFIISNAFANDGLIDRTLLHVVY